MKSAPLRCWAEIDHSALIHNLQKLRQPLSKDSVLMTMVKANAYGHDAEEICKTLQKNRVQWFGVATVSEALALKKAHIKGFFLILSPALVEEQEMLLKENFIPTISTLAEAQSYSRLSLKLMKKSPVHLKIDTGMGRIGLCWEEAPSEIEKILELPGIKVQGIYTHFSSADTNSKLTQKQIQRFLLFKKHFPGRLVHAANSAAILRDLAVDLPAARTGIALYGYPPSQSDSHHFQNVLSWKTRITLIRDVNAGRTLSYGATYRLRRRSRIATLAVGYGDGYPRLLSNRGEVLIQGQRAPVLGRVTMDQILVDITSIPQANLASIVTLIGRSGKDQILASDLATKTKTIPYEILCNISARVPRIHLNEKSR